MKILAKTALLSLLLIPTGTPASESTPDRRFLFECAEFYASTYRVPLELVEAVIEVESAWNPYPVSNKGAKGLMQLMPATAARFGVRNSFDVEDNIRGGVAYLSWLMRLFNGDLRLVVAAYYCGDSPIRYCRLDCTSPEVLTYVSRVAGVYKRLCANGTRPPFTFRASFAPGEEK